MPMRLMVLSQLSLLSLIAGWVAPTTTSAADAAVPAPAPRSVAIGEFVLPGADGQNVTWSSDPSVKFHVVCFLGTECPLARVYGPRLQRMSDEFRDAGFQFIGVDSNVQDSMDDVKQYVRDHGITFPVGKDYDHKVASLFAATRTPEVFVVDRSGGVQYQGRIDDQYQPGVTRSEATRSELREAIEALLAGRVPTNYSTEAVGCLIGRQRGESSDFAVTYCDQIVRVLQRHCVECHREGEIGPFSLEDFDEVIGWADMSLEVIEQGRMPPWHASPDHGSFANARHMSDDDKRLLRHWVDAGMPYGDPTELPPPAHYVEGWRLPEPPDLVLDMSDEPFPVPAEGTVEYQYFVVDPGFTEDKWVHASEVIPGNNAIVHHCIAFTRPPDGASFRDIGLLSAYVPGQIRSPLPHGYAQRIPAGSRIVFQMHYTPNGQPTEDLTRLGLVFLDADEVTHEVIALVGIQQEFEISPHEKRHVVEGKIPWFPKDGLLLSIMPHMHLRGKSFEFRVGREDRTETLLEVPNYDFNWQHNYELSSPLTLSDAVELSFAAVFDNSEDNPFNPDPAELVTWGDQTWQEMAVTFVSVARPIDAPPLDRESSLPERDPQELRKLREEIEAEAAGFANRYIERFDKSGDGYVTSNELPDSVRIFSFGQLDHNGDGRIARDEIRRETVARLQAQRSQDQRNQDQPSQDQRSQRD